MKINGKNPNQTEEKLLLPTAPTSSSSVRGWGNGPLSAVEGLFILHSVKGNQALSDVFWLGGGGASRGLEFKVKTRSTSLSLLELLL